MRTMNIITLKHREVVKCCVIVGVGLLVLLYWGRSTPASTKTRAQGLTTMRKGLEVRDGAFFLESQKVSLLSGAMHYFRVVPEYWEDRMLKFKAAGLNTLETYVAWNGHEPERGVFNFEGMYDIRRYIKLAQSVGLNVIVRPGPYICAEWDLGGLPSWLLHDPRMVLRSTYKPYLDAVRVYLKRLTVEIGDLQYRQGGPIIAFQLENEFGSYGRDPEYMGQVQQMFLENGLTELHFTCDNDRGMERGSLKGVMAMANFNTKQHGQALFDYLRMRQPDKPLMTMEFWPGWFDHWGNTHQGMDIARMEDVLQYILKEAGNVNFYMFHGGTNFGFMNGANMPYTPTITSYDYDAPISEHGFMTEKFLKIREILSSVSKETLLKMPLQPKTHSYGAVQMTSYMTLDKMLSFIKPVMLNNVVPMEMLDLNNGNGQGHGFILYRKTLPKVGTVQVVGDIRDRLQMIVNGREVGVYDWHSQNQTVQIHDTAKGKNSDMVLDLLVENMGRVNYGHYKTAVLDTQRKGLNGEVRADGKKVADWLIYPLEFKKNFLKMAVADQSWQRVTSQTLTQFTEPCLVKGSITITGTPQDTFVNMMGWTKGVVFVNGFNLGRYWKVGPQFTLYLPAPILKEGKNEILIFELHAPQDHITLVDVPVLGTVGVQ